MNFSGRNQGKLWKPIWVRNPQVANLSHPSFRAITPNKPPQRIPKRKHNTRTSPKPRMTASYWLSLSTKSLSSPCYAEAGLPASSVGLVASTAPTQAAKMQIIWVFSVPLDWAERKVFPCGMIRKSRSSETWAEASGWGVRGGPTGDWRTAGVWRRRRTKRRRWILLIRYDLLISTICSNLCMTWSIINWWVTQALKQT